MEKAFKENPFLHSDIDKAGAAQTYKADDSVIPVRTWAHGSPFNVNSHARTQASTSASKQSHASGESSGEYGDLDKYWPDPVQKEGEEQDDAEASAPLIHKDDDASFADESVQSVQSVQSDRPEQASANYDTTDLSDAFVAQFNRVLDKYNPKEAEGAREEEGEEEEEEEEYADDYVEEDEDEDEEQGPLSYEDSEAIHSRGQSRASAAEAEAEGDIGDLAAYLGMGDTEGENIFFAGAGDDASGGADDDADDDGFLPHRKDWARGAGGGGQGGAQEDDPRGHLEDIVSEYQRIYAALQSPQHDQQGQRRERGGDRASGKDKAGQAKAAKAERDQLRLLKKARREKEREPEREAGSAPEGALGAEQRHRRYLAEVASKRRAEDDMLLAMVRPCPLPPPLAPLATLLRRCRPPLLLLQKPSSSAQEAS